MKPKTTPIVIAVLIPLVSVVIALSLIYFKKRDFSGLEAFPYQTFVQEPKNLQGNKYLLKAELEVQLANFDNGRLVSVNSWATARSLPTKQWSTSITSGMKDL